MLAFQHLKIETFLIHIMDILTLSQQYLECYVSLVFKCPAKQSLEIIIMKFIFQMGNF